MSPAFSPSSSAQADDPALDAAAVPQASAGRPAFAGHDACREASALNIRPEGSIYVLQIALVALKRGYGLLGALRRQRLHIGIGLHQHRMHVLGHALGVAA